MKRLFSISLAILLGGLGVANVRADVREPSTIQLARESRKPAHAGEFFEGVIEFIPGASGTIDFVETGGEGWESGTVEPPGGRTVTLGQMLRIPFRSKALDASRRLRVRISLNGDVIERSFDLSPEHIAALNTPSRSVCVARSDQPADDEGAGGRPRGCDDQEIRVRGRIQYVRPGVDNSNPPNGTFTDGFDSNGDGDYNDPNDIPDVPPTAIGADNIRFYILDEDGFDSELMYDGLTDQDGNFDVTICWDDCDVTGCDDPDIYLVYATDMDVATVRREDNGNAAWFWSTQETQIFEDYEGHDIDFGTQQPSNTAQFAAIHMHNSIVRAHRYVLDNSGYDAPHVDLIWQTTTGAFYRPSQEQIFVGPDEQWNEGTQVHEWGHHLLYQWTTPVGTNYCNGFCDDNAAPCGPGDPCVGNGGHCVWCNENPNDAWNEGFPDWLGSVVMRIWQNRYNDPPPLAINDNRYKLETVQTCCDGNVHAPLITEGVVAALLRDIEDPPQDPGQSTCPQDAMGLGGDEILAIVRAYAPIRMVDFLAGFRTEYPQQQHDLYATAQSVAAGFVSGWSLPPVFVTAVNGCGSYRSGATITLSVEANASRYSTCMRWQRNGVDLSDGARISGATSETLVITNAQVADAGQYTLRISSCDGPAGTPCNGSESTTSPPIAVRVIGSDPGHRITGWGINVNGELGRGTNQPNADVNPAEVLNLSNAVSVAAGYARSVAVLADGTAWSWGDRYLGDGTSAGSATPVRVSNLTDVVAVAAGGWQSSMALDAGGHVWTWGSNYQGILGYAQPSGAALNPGQVNLECVVDISMGRYHAAAVTSDGSLWLWGTNANGELGQGTTGGASETPVRVSDLANVIDVECGHSHTLALRADGTLWACGWNNYGQLGDGTTTTRNRFVRVTGLGSVVGMAGGDLHSLALLSNGQAWAWGYNGNHTLGTGAPMWSNYPTPAPVIQVGPVRAVDAGNSLSIFTAADGTIWTCGSNGSGQLGRAFDGTEAGWLPAPIDVRVGAGVVVSAGNSFVMAVAPGARILAPLADQLVAGASTARLSVASVGEPPLNFQWSRRQPDGTFLPLADGARFAGASTPILTIAQTELGDSGAYRVHVWNTSNDVTSSQAVLSTPPMLNDFDSAQDADWFGNERGDWRITNGSYDAGVPALYANSAYSSFDLPQTDCLVELDVVHASHVNFDTNGGIYLRSSLPAALPYPRGVVLAFGEAFPWGAGDIYWHRNYGGGYLSGENIAQSVYTAGQTLHLRIEVRGNTYVAWANDAALPTTTLTTPDFPAGKIALLDGVAAGTSFDNIFIQTLTNCDPGSGNQPVRIIERPQSRQAPAGTPIALEVSATGTGPLSYQWLRNGQRVPGATEPTHAFTAGTGTAGRWECTVSNACGAVGSYPAFITLDGGGGPTGDLDQDGHVGLADLALILSSFGACAGSPAFLPAADFDGDGCVGLADLAALLANFGT